MTIIGVIPCEILSSPTGKYLEHIEGEPERVEPFRIGNSVDLHAAGLIEIFVVAGRLQLILLREFLISRAGLDQLIEHVVIALPGALKGDTTLLQQVILDDASLDHPLAVEAHLHKLAEAGAVVVPHGFRVACFDVNKIFLVN